MLDSALLFLDKAAGEGERRQELPSRGVRLCFGQIGEHLQEAVTLVWRQSQQFPAHAFHHLHGRVGIDVVVIAALKEPDNVNDQSGKGGHKRIHDGHPRNLTLPYDNDAAGSQCMRMHSIPSSAPSIAM